MRHTSRVRWLPMSVLRLANRRSTSLCPTASTRRSPRDAVLPQGEENELRVECVASPDAPIVLTLGVNGEALVRAEDEETTRGFDGFGIIVDTTEGGAEALFDDFVVTELLPK